MASANDAKLRFETSEEIRVAPTFDSMGLKEDLLRGIYAYSELSACSSYCISTLCTKCARVPDADESVTVQKISRSRLLSSSERFCRSSKAEVGVPGCLKAYELPGIQPLTGLGILDLHVPFLPAQQMSSLRRSPERARRPPSASPCSSVSTSTSVRRKHWSCHRRGSSLRRLRASCSPWGTT